MGKYTLWQGADHLLHIFSRFGFEDYKRFYLSDIQAVIARKTIVGKVHNIILGGLLSIFSLPTLILEGSWFIFCVFMTAMIFGLLLINMYLGPTCQTTLMTAVQTEKLQSLHRLKAAFRIMDGLGLDIQQVQGALTREDLFEIPLRSGGCPTAHGPGPSNASPPKPVKHESGGIHRMLFTLLLVNGVLVSTEFFFCQIILTIFSSAASLCIGILVIIALVRQHDTDLPGPLRMMTWTSLGFVAATFVIGYVAGMVLAFKNPSMAYNQWEIVKSISNLSPWDSHLKLSHNILILGSALFIGLPGLIILQRSEVRAKGPLNSKSTAARQKAISRDPDPG